MLSLLLVNEKTEIIVILAFCMVCLVALCVPFILELLRSKDKDKRQNK